MMRIVFTISFIAMFLMACSTTQEVQVTQSPEAPEIPESLADKLLIELRPEVDPDAFSLEFADYELKKKYLASKSKNEHLFSFNPVKIRSAELIKKLSKHRQVVSVEALSDQLKAPSANKSSRKRTVEIE